MIIEDDKLDYKFMKLSDETFKIRNYYQTTIHELTTDTYYVLRMESVWGTDSDEYAKKLPETIITIDTDRIDYETCIMLINDCCVSVERVEE